MSVYGHVGLRNKTNNVDSTTGDPRRVIGRRYSTSHEPASPCRYFTKLLYPPGTFTMKVLLLLLTVTVASAVTRFDGEQVLRVIPQDERQLQELVKLAMTDVRVDFWKSPGGLFRPVDVRVPKNLLMHIKNLLGNTGIQYTVMIDDLQQLINNQTSTSIPNEFDFDQYNSYEEINTQLQDFTDKYSSLTTLIKIGVSHESRDIYAIRVGGSGTNKPAIFLEGQIHAREWIVSATLLYNIKFLLEGYGTEDRITKLMDEVDFYFLPVTNVDGYVYTRTTNRMWRKTRSGPIDGCYGVDPNRNWNDHFGDPGASNNPCSDTYHGPSAFSEVETKSLSNWVLENGKNIKAYLAVHSYSEMWMSPYGWTHDLPPDYEDQNDLGGKAVSAIREVNGLNFKHGSIADVIYVTSGNSADWAYTEAGIKYAYAIELRDKGRYGFVLPPDQIKPSAEEFFAALLVTPGLDHRKMELLVCRRSNNIINRNNTLVLAITSGPGFLCKFTISTMKALLLLITITVVSATNITRFDGEQVLRVIPQDERQLEELVKLGMKEGRLDFWKGPSGLSRPVDVRVPKDLLMYVKKLLTNTGIKHSVMIDDLQQLIDNQTSTSSATGFNFNKYNTYEAIDAQLQDFADKYSKLSKLIKIGFSHQGRAINAIKVGRPKFWKNKPAIFLEGQIHAREWIVSATLLYNIKFLLEGYGTEDRTTKLMDGVDFYFLPVTNVDGYVYTWTTNRMWRKTRSGPRKILWGLWSCYGVDPNRNWNDHFAYPGASGFPCSDTYHGPSPFSEVETKSLSNWVLENGKNIQAYLSVHSYSEMWMSPYGWTSHALPPDYLDQNYLGAKAVSAIREVHGRNFTHGSIADVIYVTSGNSADWAYTEAGIKYSYAIELRDKGRYGFVLPPDQIKPSAEEFFAALLVVAEHIANEFYT
ncbi:uncharacterized protein LOC144872352 [Branchiostoma floridae x Branchiostoma japonicum]